MKKFNSILNAFNPFKMNNVVSPGNNSKNIFKHALKLPWNFSAWPLFTFLFPPSLYGTLFLLFFFQGRYHGYQPTISETGTELPNTVFLARFFATISITTGFTMAVVNTHVISQHPVPKLISSFFYLHAIMSTIFMAIVGLNPMNENHTLHFLGAGVGFASNLLYQLYIYILLFKFQTIFQKITRLFCILVQTFSLIVIGFTENLFDNRNNISAATTAEYLNIFFLSVFYMTFFKDLQNYQWWIVEL